MTREHKLALILAFSVLLVVGLLVGDHFSKARQPQGAGVVEVAGANPAGLPIAEPVVAPVQPVGPGATLNVADNRGGVGVEPIFNMGQTPVVNPNASIATVPTAPASDPAIAALRARLEEMERRQPVPTSPIVTNVPEPRTVTPTQPDHVTITPPAPAVAGLPVSTEKEKMHPVEEGETLYGIAKAAYGDGNLWEKLAKYNGNRVKGNTVRVGVTLRLPPKDVLLGKAVLATDQNQGRNTAPRSTPVSNPNAPTRITNTPVTIPTRTVNANGTPTGISGLVQDEVTRPVTPATPARAKTYTVKAGDTLGKIAGQMLGSSREWEKLLDANADQLESPEELKVGMVLKVPAK